MSRTCEQRRAELPAPKAGRHSSDDRKEGRKEGSHPSDDSGLLLLKLELTHVVNNVENYIMNQVHGCGERGSVVSSWWC